MSIPVFKPSIRRRDMHSVLSCLVTDVIGPASLADELVNTVSGDLGMEGGVALREYLRSIELVIRALNLSEGDKVVLSPLAPSPYLTAFEERGIIPLFADVREQDACLDPIEVEKRVKDGAKAIFLHAPLGRVPDTEALSTIGLPLIEDIGEAVGAGDGDQTLGSRGMYTIISMEPEGIATAGGGTLVLASDKSALSALRVSAESLNADAFLPDLNASLGLVQWKDVPNALDIRESISELYRQALMKGKHRTLSDTGSEGRSVSYSFPVVLSSGMNEVRRYCRKKGVETTPAFANRAMSRISESENLCPKAKLLMMSVLLFPLYPTLGKKNVQQVVKVLSTLP